MIITPIDIGTDPIVTCRKISLIPIPFNVKTSSPKKSPMPPIPDYLPKTIIGIINDIFGCEYIDHVVLNDLCQMISNIASHTISMYHSELSAMRQTILTTECNCRVIYQASTILKEIIDSYSKSNERYISLGTKRIITKQFSLDFPRMIVNYNYQQIDSIEEFHHKITKYEPYTMDITHNLYWFIITLCTQATFFYSYFLLHNLYTIDDENLFVMQDHGFPVIDIIDDKSHIDLVFHKIFLCKNIETKEIITKFCAFIHVSVNLFESSDGYIFYGKKYGVCHPVSVYWLKTVDFCVV